MRRLDKARESLQMAIAAEPENVDHYLDLSSVLNNEGDSEGAIRVINDGLRRDIEEDRLQVQIGLLYQKKGDFGAAEAWFQKSLQSNPTNRSAYLALANLMLRTDRRQAGLDLLAKSIQVLPNDPLLLYMYGGELLESEEKIGSQQLEKAAAILKKALELNPYYANTHYLLGKLYLSKGDQHAAQASFEKACAFNPEHVSAYYQLSLLARRQGKKEKAAELGKIVQKLNEKSDKSFQESFTGVLQESLRGTAGGVLMPKSID
jgi:tetratricopeptide (TPR) repeat protein